MKCRWLAILVYAFILQLTNAAPPFDVDSFLDELLAMNTRMGDFILKAKYEYRQLKANELSEFSIGAAIVDNYLSSDNTWDRNNPITQSNGQGYESNKNARFGGGKKTDIEEGNFQVEPVIGAENDHEVGESAKVDDAVAVDDGAEVVGAQAQPYDQKNDQQNDDGFSDLPAENAAPENVQDNEKPENGKHDKTGSENSGNSEIAQPNNAKPENDKRHPEGVDVDHEQDWGEETSNNESENVDEGGWLDKTIDSIVNFFS